MFYLFDDNKLDFITLFILKQVSKELGETMSKAEVLEMIERANSDKDEQIHLKDSYAIITKPQEHLQLQL